jgi:signal transduction histidine kinase/CheY-like chemotaxis protein
MSPRVLTPIALACLGGSVIAEAAWPITIALAVVCVGVTVWTDVALRRTQALLEDTRRARRVAEAESEAKSQFLANMSHEIRTPMNGVIGMIDLLLGTALDERQHRHATIIKRSATSLLGIINTVLDFSKMEAGGIELERCDFSVGQTVEEIVETFAARAHAKGLAIVCSIDAAVPERVSGDPLRLGQVLGNLLANAIKFTEEGEVAVHVRPSGARGLQFDVVDTGIGLSQESIAQLFKPFAQADASVTRKYGGTGLGLVISRQLVQLMGGDIGVESRVGEGSRFHFTAEFLPAEGERARPPTAIAGRSVLMVDDKGAVREQPPAAHPIAMASTPSERRGPRPRVFVVEDNETNRVIMTEMLDRLGYDSFTACDGLEALRALESDEHVDVVLMDCAMPQMDGYTATRELRRRERAGTQRRVPVVAVTAHSMPGDAEKCRAAGMDDYLSKPITPSTLRAMLGKWCAVTEAPSIAARSESVAVLDEGIVAALRDLQDPDRPTFLRELVDTYARDAKAKLAQLQQAIADQDLSHARALAHAVKGASRNMGAIRVAAACEACERSAGDGDAGAASLAWRRMAAELQRALPLLDRMTEPRARCAS